MPSDRRKLNENPNRICFIHLRCYLSDNTLSNLGGYTIAYRLPADPEAKHFEVAVARCHPFENFSRRIGRAVATGALNFNYHHEVPQPEDLTNEAIYNTIVDWVMKHYAIAEWEEPNAEESKTLH